MTIRLKLVLAFLAVFLIPLALTNGVFYYQQFVHNSEMINRHLESVASIQQGRIQSIYQQNLTKAKTFFSKTYLLNVIDDFNHKPSSFDSDFILEDIVDTMTKNKFIRAITIFNPEGGVIASTDEGLHEKNYSDKAAFVLGVKHFQASMISRYDGEALHVKLSGPLKIKGRLVGVLLMEVSVDDMLASIQDYTGLGDTGETILATRDENGDARFVMPTRFNPDTALNLVVNKNRQDIPIIRAIQGEEAVFHDMVDYRNVPVLSVSRFIKGANWGLVVKMDKAEALEGLSEMRDNLLVLVGIAFVLFVFLAYVLSHRITAPLIKLTDVARRISKGELGLKSDETANDEVGILARDFNRMTASLLASNTNLESKISDLNQYEKIVSCSTDVMAYFDTNFVYQMVNTTFLSKWNVPIEKVIGHTVTEVLGDTFFKSVIEPKIKECLEGKVDHHQRWVDFPIEGKKYMHITLSPYEDAQNNILGFMVNARDMTQQYKAQKELLNKEREQSEILDTMIDAVITMDEDYIVLTFNRAAENLFGYLSDEVIGRNVNVLMPQEVASRHDGIVNRYLETGDAHVIGVGREVVAQKKTKETFPMRLSVAELPMQEGKRRFIGSCVDLTDYRSQEEQLRRAQRMDALGKLTGGIAHDFNNMLGIVLGYSELLKGALEQEPKLAKYNDEIYRAGKRGEGLTRKLLSFSGQQVSEKSITDINQIMSEDQDLLSKTLTVSIHLTHELSPDLWAVYIDTHAFEDMLLNMSINALHAMPDGGELTFATANVSLSSKEAFKLGLSKGGYVRLRISDTGCGMSEEVLGKLFDPFFTTKGDQGTGLGLTQVFSFLKISDAVIDVHSEIGLGTQFTIYFPRYLDETQAVLDPPETTGAERLATGKSKEGETILVVDDEKVLGQLAREILVGGGYQVEVAESGAQALAYLTAHSADLLLSDILMPEMNGYQLAESVNELYPNIAVLFVSGYKGDKDSPGSLNGNENIMIEKPYSAELLLSTVRKMLDRK